MTLHPDYISAKHRLQAFIRERGGASPKLSIFIGARWDEALAKDSTGQQCVHLVEELIERFTPMES